MNNKELILLMNEAGFFKYNFDKEFVKYSLIFLSKIYMKQFVTDARNNIFGIKFVNEKLLFYFHENNYICFPLIKYNVDLSEEDFIKKAVNGFYETLKYRNSNPDDLHFKLSNKSKKINKKEKYIKENNKKEISQKRLKKILKFYKSLENKIVFYIHQEDEYIITKEDLYEHFYNYKRKYIRKAIKISKKLFDFCTYIECLDNLIVYSNEIEKYKNRISNKMKYQEEIRAKDLFAETKNTDLLVRNGIDDYKKLYGFVSKIYLDDFYFDEKRKIIMKEKPEDIQNVEEEFSVDAELEKLINMEDLADEF